MKISACDRILSLLLKVAVIAMNHVTISDMRIYLIIAASGKDENHYDFK